MNSRTTLRLPPPSDPAGVCQFLGTLLTASLVALMAVAVLRHGLRRLLR